MDSSVLIAIITGAFTVGGIVVGATLSQVNSYYVHKRELEGARLAAKEVERAVFHGSFALCNFIAGKLNEWDQSRNLHGLTRLVTTGPYLAKLIDRSPADSERLMVSLFDLGLRLEGLLYSAGFAAGSTETPTFSDLGEVEAAVEELAAAVEVVQILLTGELPFMGEDELDQFPSFSETAAEKSYDSR